MTLLLSVLISLLSVALFTHSTQASLESNHTNKMKHHLVIGTWTPPGRLYTVEFDEEALTLELVNKTEIPEAEPVSWLTISHDKKTLYGAAMKKWSSFAINSPTDIVHLTSHDLAGHPLASSPDSDTRAIFVLAAHKPPYNVYGAPFYNYSGYGSVFSVDPVDGGLAKNIQNYEYQENSGVHGMAFDLTETYLYSADLQANKIWTHKKDAETGDLVLHDSIEAPSPDDHPRWVELHPSGKYLYVLMETGNRLGVYVIDEKRNVPVFTHITYPLLPTGLPPTNTYRGDVCFTTKSGEYLFATTRGTYGESWTGYITAFKLGPNGEIERQLFIHPTPNSGGHANAVSPSDFSDEWLALCDDQDGFVEIYRFKDEMLARVARLDIPEEGFGMNAVWYD